MEKITKIIRNCFLLNDFVSFYKMNQIGLFAWINFSNDAGIIIMHLDFPSKAENGNDSNFDSSEISIICTKSKCIFPKISAFQKLLME